MKHRNSKAVLVLTVLACVAVPASGGEGVATWNAVDRELSRLLRDADPVLRVARARAGGARPDGLAGRAEAVLADWRKRTDAEGASAVPAPQIEALADLSRILRLAARDAASARDPDPPDDDLVAALGRFAARVEARLPDLPDTALTASRTAASVPAVGIGESDPGRILGVVTDDGTGAPIADALVQVYDEVGFLTSVFTETDGSYGVDPLAPGTYYLATVTETHADEAYDDLPCEWSWLCEPTAGTGIPVGPGGTSSGIDLALTLGGSIRGTLTEAGSGEPLEDVWVDVFEDPGSGRRSAQTAADGGYTVSGLPPGIYHVRTFGGLHLGELYDDIPCHRTCDVSTGTDVPVPSGAETAGIDFVLDRAGTISGTVTEMGTGNPVPSGFVRIYDSDGIWWHSPSIASDGTYTAEGVVPGTYFARTITWPYLDELYDDLPCPFECDAGLGAPIPVDVSEDVFGIDFALDVGGTIRGILTDALSSEPIVDGLASVFDGSGDYLATGFAGAGGSYEVSGLPTGTYFVKGGSGAHVTELYDDLPCDFLLGSCDVATGAAVAVVQGAETTGVDFALPPTGQISGTVTESGTGTPLMFTSITTYHESGIPVARNGSAAGGVFHVSHLPAGRYHLVVTSAREHALQIHPNLPFGVRRLDGVPVDVLPGETTSGIEISLPRLGVCGLADELHLEGVTVSGISELVACGDIEAGPSFEVSAGGRATLRAGGSIALGAGVAVESGGALAASTGPPFPPSGSGVIYREDFDDGFAVGWSTSGSREDLWRLDAECPEVPAGRRVLSFNRPAPDCTYDLRRDVSGWAKSPRIDLSGATAVAVSIRHRWEREAGVARDVPRVEVSVGNDDWTEVWSTTESSSNGWVTEVLDLSAYAGTDFWLRFSFDSIDTELNGFAGWAIDDVVVTTESP